MAYTQPQPPYTDGICSFIDNDPICMAVQNSLNTIRSGFQPTEYQQVVDVFYITATYNSTVAGTNIDANNVYPIINGDTAQHCLYLFDNPTQATGM